MLGRRVVVGTVRGGSQEGVVKLGEGSSDVAEGPGRAAGGEKQAAAEMGGRLHSAQTTTRNKLHTVVHT